MKKTIFFVVCLVVLLTNQSVANPTYFTLDMKFDSYYVDQRCYIHPEVPCNPTAYEDSGFYGGAPISFTFVVDYEAKGKIRNTDGSIEYVKDSFFIDYVGGDAFGHAFEPGYDGYYESYGVFDGVDSIYVGDKNNRFRSYEITFNLLKIGDRPELMDGFHFDFPIDDSGLYTGSDNYDVVVSDISKKNPFAMTPVPEPSTVVLFSIGVMGVVWQVRRRNSA